MGSTLPNGKNTQLKTSDWKRLLLLRQNDSLKDLFKVRFLFKQKWQFIANNQWKALYQTVKSNNSKQATENVCYCWDKMIP